MYINNLDHMTKMTAMSIYGKKNSKSLFSETNEPISKKFDMLHRGREFYMNHDKTWHEASMTLLLQCVYKS